MQTVSALMGFLLRMVRYKHRYDFYMTVPLSGRDGYGGLDVTGDGQPDGVHPEIEHCHAYSDVDQPHADDYCYPG
ncbi:hypothetical protein [Pseudomonas sp. VI4.1]|uniref:hypothetical protein n=1 Tax=Pseudomonas sp. VI4.1 TaxID=1941346 RepID=UPI0010080FC5|nr:hypothetical protein [Pseudomonas sp. VI4.1]